MSDDPWSGPAPGLNETRLSGNPECGAACGRPVGPQDAAETCGPPYDALHPQRTGRGDRWQPASTSHPRGSAESRLSPSHFRPSEQTRASNPQRWWSRNMSSISSTERASEARRGILQTRSLVMVPTTARFFDTLSMKSHQADPRGRDAADPRHDRRSAAGSASNAIQTDPASSLTRARKYASGRKPRFLSMEFTRPAHRYSDSEFVWFRTGELGYWAEAPASPRRCPIDSIPSYFSEK